MTHNDLVKRVAIRAGELSQLTVRELRLLHPDNLAGTTSGVQWQGLNKGKLIEQIIYSEFDRSVDYLVD